MCLRFFAYAQNDKDEWMRIIKEEQIVQAVTGLIRKVNFEMPSDTICSFKMAQKQETPAAKKIYDYYFENAATAKKESLPICQDTGIAVFFIDVGEEVVLKTDIYKAINKAVDKAYTENYLRASVVSDPLFERKNTKNNTPAVIYTNIVKGSKIKINFMPKGAGSENMSALKMLKPAEGKDGLVDFVINTVTVADANPCPPIVVGIGVGGTFDYCAVMAKRAMLRPLGKNNKDKKYAALEKELLEKINKLGIGPQGFGGNTTALAVNIEFAPCHMASLPVAVNIGCHVHRHGSVVI